MATSLRAWATTLLLGVCWTTGTSGFIPNLANLQLVAPVRRSGMTTGFSQLTVGEMFTSKNAKIASLSVMSAKKKPSKSKKSKGSEEGSMSAAGGKMEAAKLAASAAESLSLLEEDDEDEEDEEEVTMRQQTSDDTKARISKFDEQMKEVVAKQKSSDELDVRGTRLSTQSKKDPNNKLDELDQKIKAALRGEPVEKKKETKIKTETGEELYLTEFAPGASISPFALPENLDDLYMPLPSELLAKQKMEEEKKLREEEAVSGLYGMPETDLIEDDALFRIKSVFDDTKAPGTVRRAEGMSSSPAESFEKRDLDEIIRRDREALRSKALSRPAMEVENKNMIEQASESVSEVVRRVLGLIVVADFFVVIGFLGWLAVAIVYQFAVCGGLNQSGKPICPNALYDTWYSLWTPVIQPALGILMASVILQATANAIIPKNEEK
uniref:Uncharacterized protein n=1 Tax=Hanusia phi TaxID=3032 RepID=A0A7S0H6I4_9CRYP